mmetsp:Transcript_30822/g.72027  ORF Transcript_30822/g.72027 Transcript_30822/m.72027 type:complete len:243 (-) Transcript_30822:287-1015(-)
MQGHGELHSVLEVGPRLVVELHHLHKGVADAARRMGLDQEVGPPGEQHRALVVVHCVKHLADVESLVPHQRILQRRVPTHNRRGAVVDTLLQHRARLELRQIGCVVAGARREAGGEFPGAPHGKNCVVYLGYGRLQAPFVKELYRLEEAQLPRRPQQLHLDVGSAVGQARDQVPEAREHVRPHFPLHLHRHLHTVCCHRAELLAEAPSPARALSGGPRLQRLIQALHALSCVVVEWVPAVDP